MKKSILILGIAFSTALTAQVNIPSEAQPSISAQNPFIDASGYMSFENSEGKGLYFPRTDLTKWVFKTDLLGQYNNFKTAFDGMVVYNMATGNTLEGQGVVVAVSPGFYYFSNPTADPTVNGGAGSTDISNGKWVKVGGADIATGVANGNFWSLVGNSGTTEATVAASTATTPYQITAGNWAGTTDAKSYTIGTNNIARLTVGAIPQTVGGTAFDFVMNVYGKAHFDQGIVTSNSTYPDYVFDKYFTGKSTENSKYNFLTLAETEKYIKENNHLPGVTSINDLAKENGKYMIDATQLSVQSLEKIEELYLHTIEQQKEIDALKAEIKEIKAALKK